MTDKEIEKGLAEIRANFAFEGIHLTPQNERDARDIMSGRVTADEVVARIIRDLKNKKGRTKQ